jgi:hypothetical protein
MNKIFTRREFFVKVTSVSAVIASGGVLSACGDDSPPIVDFTTASQAAIHCRTASSCGRTPNIKPVAMRLH